MSRMFNDLLRGLLAPSPARLPEPDAKLALAALLVRVARSDGDYAEAEIVLIDRVLAKRHGLSPFEAAKLRRDAEELERQAPDTVRFTRALKDAVPYEHRVEVLEALWSVVLADGVRDEEEDSVLRLVANLLGVNDVDSNMARMRVAEGRT
jgi:uncharacterized tellurite resistance protein B-like protein